MSRQQSTLSRQLVSSIVSVKSLLPSVSTPEQVAERVRVHREQYVARIAWIVEGEYEDGLPAWIDSFCHSCDTNECAQATPQQLAAKIFDLGWTIEKGLTGCLLLCPSCTCGEVVK